LTAVIEVFYDTENSKFRFTVDDVCDYLTRIKTEYDAKEVNVLKNLLLSASGDSITIRKDLRSFSYIALNLIRDSKGTAPCSAFGKSYESGELKLVAVGHRETPFSVNVKGKGWLPNLFGGKGHRCPEGHELIGMVTWRT
jgi:hypothetical protein